jgi:hypothetical protein
VTGKPAWWETMVGPTRPIDTERLENPLPPSISCPKLRIGSDGACRGFFTNALSISQLIGLSRNDCESPHEQRQTKA